MNHVVVLTASSMRARRRPWAIAAVWAWYTALALGTSWPMTSLVRAAYAGSPRGDGPLWDAGAHPLLDFLAREAHGLRAVSGAAAVVFAAAAVLGLVPNAAMMVTMAYATPGGRPLGLARSIDGALRAFPALARMLVVVGFAQALALAAAGAFGDVVEAWTHDAIGEAHAQTLGAALAFLPASAFLTLGVVHDLARAAVVRFHLNAFRALSLAARTFRSTPLSLLWSWAWRATTPWAPVAAAAFLAGRIGSRGGLVLVALAFVHQSVVLTRIAFHASWLAKALRAVDHRGVSER